MKTQNILFWVSVIVSTLFGIIATGFGIYLAVKGQDCLSYNDYACAFGAMFSFIIIPYGLAVLLFVGVTCLPFPVARLIGAILSALIGMGSIGLCCIVVLGAASSINADGAIVTGSDMIFFLFPFLMFLGGSALLGVGITGVLKARTDASNKEIQTAK